MHVTKSCINVRYYIYLPISSQKHGPLDPTRNIKTKWDIIEWTSDGHAVSTPLVSESALYN
ncbi:hypothetical protein ACQJBY_006028 [Aegilops geniculata]